MWNGTAEDTVIHLAQQRWASRGPRLQQTLPDPEHTAEDHYVAPCSLYEKLPNTTHAAPSDPRMSACAELGVSPSITPQPDEKGAL